MGGSSVPPDSDFGFVPLQATNAKADFGFVPVKQEKGDVGLLQAAASGASESAFGLGGEIGAGLQAMAASMGRFESPMAQNKAVVDTYRQARSENQDIDKRSQEQHPWAYYPSLIGGTLATSRMLPTLGPAAQNAPLAIKIATSMLNAIPTGLAFGAGNSEADLTRPTAENVSRFVSDVEGSGATAGLFGAGGTLLNRGISAAPQALKSLALKVGGKVLGGTASEPAVEQALQRGAIKLFGTTEGASSRLSADLETKLGPQYREFLKMLEAKGVSGPEASAMADQWLNQAVKEEANTVGSQVPEMYMKHAEEIASKAGQDGRIDLQRAVNITRDLQSRAKYNPMVDTATNDARRAIASDARQAVEDAVAKAETSADPALSTAAKAFVPIKQRLGRAIEGEAAASRAAGKTKPLSLLDLASAGAASVTGGATHGMRGVAAGLPMAVASHLARTRGPSTLAASAYGLSRGLDKLGQPLGRALDSAGEWYGPPQTETRAAQQLLSRLLGLPTLGPGQTEGLNAPQ